MALIKELVGIGALKGQISSEKKDKDSTYHQCFLGAKRIVRRPYPIPEISTTLQKLESFTYAMA